MHRICVVALFAAAACSSRAAAPFPAGPVADLSHPYDARAIFWPTAAPFTLEKVADGITEGGYYYAANNFATSEHGGTHIDAPVRANPGCTSSAMNTPPRARTSSTAGLSTPVSA